MVSAVTLFVPSFLGFKLKFDLLVTLSTVKFDDSFSFSFLFSDFLSSSLRSKRLLFN